jgi:hypothetical protein
MSEPTLILARHAAAQLGIALKTLYRAIDSGDLGPVIYDKQKRSNRPPGWLQRKRVEQFFNRSLS